MLLRVIGALAICIFGFAHLSCAQEAENTAAPPQDVMLVLDASGSMWGRIDETPKIQIAKDVISDLLNSWDTSIRLGLMAYGHRRKGDCADIEVLVPIAEVDAKAMMSKVSPLNPRGKTPISASVKQAAEALRYTEDRATVILVSDGLETCDADPCALAKQLEETGVDFTTHVIGFDLKEEEFKALQCLATETGGAFLNASTAADLSAALEETVTATKEAAVFGVRLSAAACASCALITDKSIRWEVFPLNDLGEPLEKPAGQGVGQGTLVKVPPGRYMARGILDANSSLTAETIVDVTQDGLADAVLNMRVGRVNYSARATADTDPLTSKTFYRFFGPKNPESGKRVRYAISRAASGIQYLPEGEIVAEVSHLKVVHQEQAFLAAGETIDLPLTLNIGYVKATAMLVGETQAPGNSKFWINKVEDGPDFSRRLDYKNRNASRFAVKQGDYVVTGVYGDAQASQSVSVTTGETTDLQLDLNAGTLKLSAGMAQGAPLTSGLFWRANPVDTQGGTLTGGKSVSAKPSMVLTAGQYQVQVSHKKQRKSVDVTVTAGETTEVFVLLDAP
jgi:Ca-activated chloride channel family protein